MTTDRAAFALLFCAGLAASACEPSKNPVRLGFSPTRSGTSGFACREETDAGTRLDGSSGTVTTGEPAFLLERALDRDAGLLSFQLVIDFIGLGGTPTCRLTGLVAWCNEHPCGPIAGARRCVELSAPIAEGPRPALDAALASLAGTQLVDEAPDGWLIVRAVATTQACSDVMPNTSGSLPSLSTDALVGCAMSCPVLLDEVQGDLVLDLGVLNDRCADEVAWCASDALQREL